MDQYRFYNELLFDAKRMHELLVPGPFYGFFNLGDPLSLVLDKIREKMPDQFSQNLAVIYGSNSDGIFVPGLTLTKQWIDERKPILKIIIKICEDWIAKDLMI